MTRDHDQPLTPATPEQRRAATGLFERAGQSVAAGNHAHACSLLRECCRLDPGNLLFRQALRRAGKARYNNNGRGGWFAWLLNWPAHIGLRRAAAAARHLDVFEYAEAILARNPWDLAAQDALARSADALGLLDLAIWSLEQARQSDPDARELNRSLARLYERRGNFSQAHALWERIAESHPGDAEAASRLTRPPKPAPPSSPEMAAAPADPVERVASALRHAIDADPTSPAPYLALSALYKQAGRHEQAYQVLAAGLGPAGNAFELSEEMACLAIEPLRRDLAITLDKLSTSPGDVGLQEIRAALEREILTQEADLCRLRADRFPGQPRLRLDLGTCLLRLGQIEEAIRELTLACADEQARWRALGGLGHCWLAWGNTARALRHFEDALACAPPADPARLDLLYEAACCHAASGAPERAVERGGELAELAPGHRDILHLLPAWQARVRPAS